MKDPVMDEALGKVAERVAMARPAEMTLERDLVAAAMERARSLGQRRVAVPRKRTTALAWAALVVLAVGAAWVMQRKGEPARLLAMVEAASLVMPSHQVETVRIGEGELIERIDIWSGPGGDVYVEIHQPKTPRTFALERKSENITWAWDVTKRRYELNWPADWLAGMMDKNLEAADAAIRRAAGNIDLHAVELNDFQRMVITHMRASGGKLTVREDRGKLEGEDVRIAKISVEPQTTGKDWAAMTAWFYLTPDRSRLLRQVTRYEGEEMQPTTVDFYPIEYGPRAPASTFKLDIPRGAEVVCRGEKIKPVWETMSEAEKAEIRDTVLGLGQAWSAGDVEKFCQYYDFGAGLQYGVKGKFTAKQLRAHWTDWVRRRAGRGGEDRIFFDYAFGASKPPRGDAPLLAHLPRPSCARRPLDHLPEDTEHGARDHGSCARAYRARQWRGHLERTQGGESRRRVQIRTGEPDVDVPAEDRRAVQGDPLASALRLRSAARAARRGSPT